MSSEVPNNHLAIETRSLVLERLPLFLHEHTHNQTLISFNWLNTSGNFIVKTFGRITVTKSLHHGDVRLSRSQDTSAVAKKMDKGLLQMSLAGNTRVDMYE